MSIIRETPIRKTVFKSNRTVNLNDFKTLIVNKDFSAITIALIIITISFIIIVTITVIASPNWLMLMVLGVNG